MPRKPITDEKRESRLNLLLVPSMYQKVVTLADSQGLSANEFILRILAKTVEKNSAVIEKFQSARDAARSEFVEVD